MGFLEKLKRKRVGAKNTMFVEAGRRGGLRSEEVRRARAEQRRLMEVSAIEVAERVKALLRTPMEPGSSEPILGKEREEEGGAPEASVHSSLERALEETEVELSDMKQIRERTEAELADIKRILPSPELIEKAREELEYVKYLYDIHYTLSILENLANRGGVGKVENLEGVDQGDEALRKGAGDLTEAVKRILG